MEIKNLKGITVKQLKEFLSSYDDDIKICVRAFGDNFPVSVVAECSYYDWNAGKKVQEHNGIVIK